MGPGNTGISFYLPPITDNALRLIFVLLLSFLLQWFAATFFYIGGWESLFLYHSLFYHGSGFAELHPAQLISHLFLMQGGLSGLLDLFFMGLLLYFFGSELERQWGGHNFLKFFLVTTIGGVIGACLMRLIPGMVRVGFYGLTAPLTAILVAYAMLWPNRKVLLFFVIPVRIKMVLLVGGALYALLSIVSGQFEVLISMTSGALSASLFLYYYARKGMKKRSAETSWSSRASSASPAYIVTQTRSPSLKERIAARKKKRRLEKKQAEIDRRIAMKEEVDRLLEKISKEGMDSLTHKEKRFLDQASKLF